MSVLVLLARASAGVARHAHGRAAMPAWVRGVGVIHYIRNQKNIWVYFQYSFIYTHESTQKANVRTHTQTHSTHTRRPAVSSCVSPLATPKNREVLLAARPGRVVPVMLLLLLLPAPLLPPPVCSSSSSNSQRGAPYSFPLYFTFLCLSVPLLSFILLGTDMRYHFVAEHP